MLGLVQRAQDISSILRYTCVATTGLLNRKHAGLSKWSDTSNYKYEWLQQSVNDEINIYMHVLPADEIRFMHG